MEAVKTVHPFHLLKNLFHKMLFKLIYLSNVFFEMLILGFVEKLSRHLYIRFGHFVTMIREFIYVY